MQKTLELSMWRCGGEIEDLNVLFTRFGGSRLDLGFGGRQPLIT